MSNFVRLLFSILISIVIAKSCYASVLSPNEAGYSGSLNYNVAGKKDFYDLSVGGSLDANLDVKTDVDYQYKLGSFTFDAVGTYKMNFWVKAKDQELRMVLDGIVESEGSATGWAAHTPKGLTASAEVTYRNQFSLNLTSNPIPEPLSLVIWAGLAACGMVSQQRRRKRPT